MFVGSHRVCSLSFLKVNILVSRDILHIIGAPEVLPVAADPGAEVGLWPQSGALTPGVVVTVSDFPNINIRRLKGIFSISFIAA